MAGDRVMDGMFKVPQTIPENIASGDPVVS